MISDLKNENGIHNTETRFLKKKKTLKILKHKLCKYFTI